MKTIKVYNEEYADDHIVGDKYCQVEWCGCQGFPRECECGGLIHAAFGDENSDCDYWLYKKCDKCKYDFIEKEGQ